MTITSPTRTRPLSAKVALVSALSLGLLAGPVAFAGPASAMGDHSKKDNCSVTALTPRAAGHHGKEAGISDHGKKDRDSVRVRFPFKIQCDEGTRVRFDQKMFQKHGRGDVERIGSAHGWVWVGKSVRIVNVEKVFADRDEKFVKVFHTVRIQFKDKDKSDHRSWSSDFDRSDTVRIWVSSRK